MKDRWDNRPWLQRLGDAVSQLANVLLLNGMSDESISGRSWRNTALRRPPRRRWWITRMLAEALFWPLDRGQHCRLAFEQDIERSRLRWLAADAHRRRDVSASGTGPHGCDDARASAPSPAWIRSPNSSASSRT